MRSSEDIILSRENSTNYKLIPPSKGEFKMEISYYGIRKRISPPQPISLDSVTGYLDFTLVAKNMPYKKVSFNLVNGKAIRMLKPREN